ncbi:MAG: cell envelope integrity protein TolA [Bermanella sp.]
MQLHFTDPTSFKIPMIGSGLMITVLMLLLSHQWIGEEDRLVKTPQHIAARIVQLNEPKPKAAKVKQPKKQAPAKKSKPVKKVKPKPVKKVEAKKAETVIKKEAAPAKPLPLPGADFLDALEKEEENNARAEAEQKKEQAKQALKDQQQVADYSSQINALIQSVWRFPPSAKHDEEVILRVYLVPTGEVTEVLLLESSGNAALDRSAEQAVWKVGNFPVPEDATLFEKQFRQIVLKLKPENARL